MRKLDYDRIISEIQEWIKDYCKSANAEGIVVGISGGIDSAVTSTWCANALGKDAVIGLGLPCLSIPCGQLNTIRSRIPNSAIRTIEILLLIFPFILHLLKFLLKKVKRILFLIHYHIYNLWKNAEYFHDHLIE